MYSTLSSRSAPYRAKMLDRPRSQPQPRGGRGGDEVPHHVEALERLAHVRHAVRVELLRGYVLLPDLLREGTCLLPAPRGDDDLVHDLGPGQDRGSHTPDGTRTHDHDLHCGQTLGGGGTGRGSIGRRRDSMYSRD